jgi:hypothetical protein
MKGIYITEEGKREIEGKIDELERQLCLKKMYESTWHGLNGKKLMLKEILSTATILPVEDGYNEFYYNSNEYPQGVIIKPKQ